MTIQVIDHETGEIFHHQAADTHEVPFIRTRYNYNMDAASRASALVCKDPSLAQQHAKEDADINTLVKRFGITGTMPQLNMEALDPEAFHDITDFHSAINQIKAATNEFMRMPAELRTRFRNDPHELLAFVSDPKNREEGEKLGIFNKKAPEQPPGAPVAGASPPAPVTPPAPPAAS